MKEDTFAGKYDQWLLQPNRDLSKPIGEVYEEIYQVDQSILQLPNRGGKPEIYDALFDADPESLLSFFGLKFTANSKRVEEESIERVQRAYSGENLVVPFDQAHLLFPLAEIENKRNSLQFVASAWVANAMPGESGKVGTVQLEKIAPYYLLYLVHPSQDNKSFTSYVQKQFQFVQAEPLDMQDSMKLGQDIMFRLFAMVRRYQSSTTAATY